MSTAAEGLTPAQLADRAAAREAFIQRIPDYAMSLIRGTLRPEVKEKCISPEYIREFVRALSVIQQTHAKPEIRKAAAQCVQPLATLKRTLIRTADADNVSATIYVNQLTGLDMTGKTLNEMSVLLLAHILAEVSS